MSSRFRWSRKEGYEVSTIGDKRFSAFGATLDDGRTIEMHYQCDVKMYQPGGRNWKLGKGKPPLDRTIDLWTEYLTLWVNWASKNTELLAELRQRAIENDCCLKDTFAKTDVNQARALVTILNALEAGYDKKQVEK